MTNKPRDWEASKYDRLSTPQQAMGADVIERLTLTGNETVLDAGCGTGRVTAQLLEKLPKGRVIGIDGSPAMIEQASRLLPRERVQLEVQNLAQLTLIDKVDAILSTATFHWISDHDILFRRLGAVLKPGGQLEVQCGGAGNIVSVEKAIAELTKKSPWREAFADWSPWNFAGLDETQVNLQAAGFTDTDVWLEKRDVTTDEPYAYLRTVILGSHLERLPELAQDEFVSLLCEMLAPDGAQLKVDYVRLNISARLSDEPLPHPGMTPLEADASQLTRALRGD